MSEQTTENKLPLALLKKVLCRYSLLPLLLLAAILIPPACRNGKAKTDGFYDTALIRTYLMYNTGETAAAKHYIDSIYTNYPATSGYATYKKMMQRLQWGLREGRSDNMALVDSMTLYMEQTGIDKVYRYDYANLFNIHGDYCFVKNELPKAIENYSKCKIISEETKDSCAIANATYHLGMVNYRQEKYDDAIRDFKEAIVTSAPCNYNKYVVFRIEELMGNIGLAETQLEHYDSALAWFRKAINYTAYHSKQLDLNTFADIATGIAWGNMAKVFIAQGKEDSAELYLRNSIAKNDHADRDARDAIFSRMRLAELYYKQGKKAEAAKELNTVAERERIYPTNEIRIKWLYLQYRMNNTGSKADSYMTDYVALRDSLEEPKRKLKQTDYSQLFKTKEAEYKVTILQKDNELTKIYLALAASILLLVLGVVVFIYRNYKRTQRNLAELKRLNDRVYDQKQQLETTMGMLQQSNNDKDRILHVVAHDLRSPVSAIISVLELARMETDPTEKDTMLQMIGNASGGALVLINEILELSDAGLINENTPATRIDITDLVKNTVKLLKIKADEKQQHLTLAEPPTTLFVTAHAEKLVRVVSNLITNAIKFSNKASAIKVSIAQGSHNKVVISVADRGMGISTADKAKIFDTFTSARKKGTAGERSYGLGLSICKQIIESYNGAIWVDSEEGKGSTFYIELPLAP